MKNGAKSVEPIHWAIPSQSFAKASDCKQAISRIRRRLACRSFSEGRRRDYLFTRVVLYSYKGRSTPHPPRGG